MHRGFFCAIALVLGLVWSNQATADVIDSSGAGFAFADNVPAGATSAITIGADETITNVQVTLSGLTHSWVGDLIARITSPSGTTADLFVRIGSGTFGDSSNLNGNYTFSDGGANWSTTAASIGGNATMPAGTYQAETNGGGAVSLATAFAGESTQGDWTLFISDNADFDTGSLGSWGVNISSNITAVPEPGCLGLAVLAGAVMLRRRRSASVTNRD